MDFPYDDIELYENDIQMLVDSTVKRTMEFLCGTKITEDRIFLKPGKKSLFSSETVLQ